MAVEMVLLMVLVSVSLGNSRTVLLRVDCPPADGVVGGTTEISCSLRKRFTADLNVIIYAVRVTKRGETDPVFWINSQGDQGDPRFDLPSREDPSLQITSTALSDEGLYEYLVVTNRGIIQDGAFRIRVTGRERVDCQSADGVVGQTTEISCSFKKDFPDQSVITAVRVTKIGATDPVFCIRDGTAQGDPRFNLPSREDPSLQITNTAVSDEGLYEYKVRTNRGPGSGAFRIRVTAKYLPPSTSTRPEKIVEGGPADLYCSASGGYPAGTIHWFDCTGTNWTSRATLEITEGEDKLVQLSSRLSLTKIDSNLIPFRCEILNSRFITEGEAYRGGFSVDCQSAVGVVGETTKISCSFRKSFPDQSITITGVIVTKRDTDPVFWINDYGVKGDPRFNHPSREDPSLQITNTAVSDEGLYYYLVVTNHGPASGTFRISVTDKYRPPSTSTRPEKIVDGGPAEFHCSASGGYPAGTIHWFGGTGTNWTNRATLEITEGEDKLVHLSSRLSLTKINSDWGRFRCVVLNSRFIPEGESYREKVGGAVASVLMVIGVIIVGLLLVLLYRRRRTQWGVPVHTTETDPDPAETDTLRPPVNPPGGVPACTTGTDRDPAETYILHAPGEAGMGSSQS